MPATRQGGPEDTELERRQVGLGLVRAIEQHLLPLTRLQAGDEAALADDERERLGQMAGRLERLARQLKSTDEGAMLLRVSESLTRRFTRARQ
jgi:hypothetical protein